MASSALPGATVPRTDSRPTGDGDLRLVGLTKRFGTFTAVDDLDLTVPQGSFFALLGPSGCGKTTTLRMVAGLEEPSAGQVLIGDEDITHLRPYKRPVNTVFQSYALFPHLTIFENVAFGLRRRGVKDVKKKTQDMLELIQLGPYGARKPAQLSGGQQQRVALGRALINEPGVLLLDEPLGALDLKLREQMQVELKAIQRDVGITFLFVTHDQEEALTLSDRIAVFNAGHIEQVGTAHEVYERPESAFVAGFVGTSNLLTGATARQLVGRDGSFAIRPEKLVVEIPPMGSGDGRMSAAGTLEEVVYGGPVTRYVVQLDAGGRLTALEQNSGARGSGPARRRGDRVDLLWRPEHVIDVPQPSSK